MQRLGYQNLYAENFDFISFVKMLIGLAFVPVHDVVYAYESLLQSAYYEENAEMLDDLLQYFKPTRIGEKKRNGVARRTLVFK